MSNKNFSELSGRIKYLREKHGLNKAELSRIVGVSASYITDLESGKRKKISHVLAQLMTWEFGFSSDWILTGKEPIIKEEEIKQALKRKLHDLKKKLALEININKFNGEDGEKYPTPKNEGHKLKEPAGPEYGRKNPEVELLISEVYRIYYRGDEIARAKLRTMLAALDPGELI